MARRARHVLEALEPALAPYYFPVASAVSYDTAFDAGREFAAAGLDAISMGFGAYMADANFVDHLVVDGRRIDFPGRLPARYLRTVAVANGFWAGYREGAGEHRRGFIFSDSARRS